MFYKKTYTKADTEFRFPLGGIGTGSVSVGSRGELCDFEIFNRPEKNRPYPYTFFSLYSRFDGKPADVRILEAGVVPKSRPIGYASYELAGVPRFKTSRVQGYGPFAEVSLSDPALPLKVGYTAFSPCLPPDAEESGIPGIVFAFTVENQGDRPCEVSVCASVSNFCSNHGFDLFGNMIVKDDLMNVGYAEGKGRGIFMSAPKSDPQDRHFGTMALVTDAGDVTCKPEWLAGGWWDGAHDFFNELAETGRLLTQSERPKDATGKLEFIWKLKTGSLAAHGRLAPKEKKTFNFVLGWHFPNRPNGWAGHICRARDFGKETVKNHYAYRFADAKAVAGYLLQNRARLRKGSRAFAKGLLTSTVDKSVLDAVNGTIAVLRSTTCFRIGEEGTFCAWEGCFDDRGSCEGNCTHVWNYAQALAYLFPSLECDMRRTEFLLETDASGKMAFRTMRVFGDAPWDMVPAADGQMGCVLRLYRDWLLTGDRAHLEACYPAMKRALDFAFGFWDKNGDCVLDSQQHNTYDIEFYGENSLTNSVFLAALLAGSKLADLVGDGRAAARWQAAFDKGSKKTDELLYKNGYYVQILDEVDRYRYQYGDGCLSDQIFGQTLAHLLGLGYILPKDHVQSAARCIFAHNFRRDFSRHLNVQRTYALGRESGLLVCSWPAGTKRPRIPFVYADEVWTGIEYQVATELIYEGYIREATELVRAVRRRYNGKNRNPFCEVECGNHYARSLASYGLIVALSGFLCNAAQKTITFDPKVNQDDFTVFFCTGAGSGIFKQKRVDGQIRTKVTVLSGDLSEYAFTTKTK